MVWGRISLLFPPEGEALADLRNQDTCTAVPLLKSKGHARRCPKMKMGPIGVAPMVLGAQECRHTAAKRPPQWARVWLCRSVAMGTPAPGPNLHLVSTSLTDWRENRGPAR